MKYSLKTHICQCTPAVLQEATASREAVGMQTLPLTLPLKGIRHQEQWVESEWFQCCQSLALRMYYSTTPGKNALSCLCVLQLKDYIDGQKGIRLVNTPNAGFSSSYTVKRSRLLDFQYSNTVARLTFLGCQTLFLSKTTQVNLSRLSNPLYFNTQHELVQTVRPSLLQHTA